MAKKTTKTAKPAKHMPPPVHNTVAGRARQHARQLKRIRARHAAAAKKTTKARAWSPDEDVACCSARAVAESLRLALGVPVSHDDVLALYWLVADDPDAGASILATLDAASEFGIAGFKFRQAFPDFSLGGRHVAELASALVGADEAVAPAHQPVPWAGPLAERALTVASQLHPLIIGLELPYGEPHTVAVAPDGTWWSWGEPYQATDFPGAVIEEAWAVTW